LSEAPQTIEGWYAQHDFRAFDRSVWAGLPKDRRRRMLSRLARTLEFQQAQMEGQTAVYQCVGHKADLLILHLRPTTEMLLRAEREIDTLPISAVLHRPYSYLSVTELSLYEAEARGGSTDREILMQQEFVRRRLMPEIPSQEDKPWICFYPMNKRRGEAENWYTLPKEERRTMMKAHAETGRLFSGQVLQMITGSTGLDDWEWGVTLFSGDPLVFKKLVYQMRFDEVSARFAEFGTFVVGRRIHPAELPGLYA
jgi:chlorite dismutase